MLGVDVGTSSCKAVAFTLSGSKLASASRGYPTFTDERGGARQDPASWWEAVQDAIRATLCDVEGPPIGIGLSAQIGTHLLVDDAIRPLADAWTWQDGGAASELEHLASVVNADALSADLSTWLPAGSAWPLPRLLWLRSAHPKLFVGARYLLQPKDLMLYNLTGVLLSDASSWRGLVRPDGTVHLQTLSALGLPNLLPPITEPTASAGSVTAAAAAALGIPLGTPVFVGWNDFNCALLGTGISRVGDGFDIAGTSEHIGVLSPAAVTDGSINSVPFAMASQPHSFVNYGVTSNGGSVTAWLASTYLESVVVSDRNRTIADLSASVAAGSDGLLFLPYLNAERSPVWDFAATAAYSGLRSSHGLRHLMRSALEGVAFNLRQIRDASPASAGRPEIIRASGGPTGMRLWNSIKADVLGTPLAVMAEKDSAALGAAIVAAVGANRFDSAQDAMDAMTRIDYVVEPQGSSAEVYDRAFERFSTIYPALAPVRTADIRSK